MVKYTICDSCPCLNIDYENGARCNLDYDTNMAWVRKLDKVIVEDTAEMRLNQKKYELFDISYNCKLKKIVFNGGIFYPERNNYAS